MHIAQQDSTPLILFVGQVGRDCVDREAFQEVDYRRMFGGIAKWAAEIDRAERMPEYVAQAFRVALSGRPGPVVLALPEDMLAARAGVADAPRDRRVARRARGARTSPRRGRCSPAPGARSCIVGGSRWDRRPAATGALRPCATRCRSAAAFAGRTCSTIAIPTTQATSASASTRRWPRASATPMCCW